MRGRDLAQGGFPIGIGPVVATWLSGKRLRASGRRPLQAGRQRGPREVVRLDQEEYRKVGGA